MNFTISGLVAAVISSIILLLSLLVFYNRLRGIRNRVTPATFRALSSFGLSSIFMILLTLTAQVEASLVMTWAPFMFGFILIAQLYIEVSNERYVRIMSIVVVIIAIIVAIFNYLDFIGLITTNIPLIIGLAILAGGSFIRGLYLLRESPSAFSASTVLVLLLFIILGASFATRFVTTNPHFFMLSIIPVIITASVMASLLRPWRHIVSMTIGLLALTVGVSLFYGAYVDGNVSIMIFSVLAAFAASSTVFPIDFFIEQSTATRTSTSTYVSFTLLFVALLVITHSNNYAIAYSSLAIWDPNILFIDWLLGFSGVCCFVLAAIASSFSARTLDLSKEALVGLAGIMITLGHPFVQNGRYELQPLYIVVFGLLIFGFLAFFKLNYQLYKVGSGRAGLRFLAFMFASLWLGIVAMFADLIPFELLIPMEIGAGILLILSSPRTRLPTGN